MPDNQKKNKGADFTNIRAQIIGLIVGGVITALVTNLLFIVNINETIRIIRQDQQEIKQDLQRLEKWVLYDP